MIVRKFSQRLAVATLIALAAFGMGAQNAVAATVPYEGEVTAADGSVGILLGAPASLPLPATGKGVFTDVTNVFESVNFQVGAFFFSSLWTGACTTPGALDCVTTDPDFMLGSTFVPIDSILSNTLTFDGTGSVTGGALSFSTFSVTFGVPLGDVILDQDGGVFSLMGALGNASGTGGFSVVPVPAAVWLFGSALLGLFGVRRSVATS